MTFRFTRTGKRPTSDTTDGYGLLCCFEYCTVEDKRRLLEFITGTAVRVEFVYDDCVVIVEKIER